MRVSVSLNACSGGGAGALQIGLGRPRLPEVGTPSHLLNVAKFRLPSSLPGLLQAANAGNSFPGLFKDRHRRLPSPVMPGTKKGLSLPRVVPSVVGPVEEGHT